MTNDRIETVERIKKSESDRKIISDAVHQARLVQAVAYWPKHEMISVYAQNGIHRRTDNPYDSAFGGQMPAIIRAAAEAARLDPDKYDMQDTIIHVTAIMDAGTSGAGTVWTMANAQAVLAEAASADKATAELFDRMEITDTPVWLSPEELAAIAEISFVFNITRDSCILCGEDEEKRAKFLSACQEPAMEIIRAWILRDEVRKTFGRKPGAYLNCPGIEKTKDGETA